MKALRLHAELLEPQESGGKTRAENANLLWKNPSLYLEEISVPKPVGDEILLRVKYSGLCGSDFHLTEMGGEALSYPGLASLPVTIGHEFSATIEEYGAGVDENFRMAFPIGTPVTAEEMLWCGKCHQCRSGNLNHCENLEEIGFTVDGAHAEFLVVPSRVCWSLEEMKKKLGPTRALQEGAMVEPYAVSFRALFQGAQASRWSPGLKILVVGSGPIGCATIDLSMLGGAVRVDVVEVNLQRRQLALSLGAHQVIAPEEIHTLSLAYDWIVDAAGAPELCAKLLHKNIQVGGTLCLLARHPHPLIFQSEYLITKNARIVGSQGHSGESAFPRVISLMANEKLQVKKLIKEVVSLEVAHSRLTKQLKCEGKILVKPGHA